ncbi:hypothetical protein EIP91_008345 [Steccherinum ochraceum]|uniref:YVC1 N-terminal linker helical domain-containing protein n=1 Tax=Steccherinum ochraceum TaxID=92696 RepID=A0A4R0RPZ2_9APHY|nr:hypothetical protein EIP91_008345 [Steccherinum ochraceum]
MSQIDLQTEDQTSLLSVKSVQPTPDTLSKLVRRLRAMTLQLLPVEVPDDSLNDPTSRIITPQVISAYMASAGDFVEALPYCLLRARKEFMWDANHNAADYGENLGRAIACEVLARRVIHRAPPDRITSMMSTRFMHREVDGDDSEKVSALEMAIDSHCTIFLSSTEAQDVVNDLWRGQLVQKHNEHHDIEFMPFHDGGHDGFWSHLSPARLAVPRYQNIFRITVWLLFLLTYSQAVREPLDRINPDFHDFDPWEVILYTLALSFCFEDVQKIYKLLAFVSWRALGFWNVVAFITDSLLLAAFILRVVGISSDDANNSLMRLRSFQCLSFVAPLIWMSTQCFITALSRMLQESGIFFALLALLGVGFLQGLYALDSADGSNEKPFEVVNVLIQALLQSPNYEWFAVSPAGLALYYLWNVATAVILLNILISLFSSAYDDVVEDAAAEYLAYFADKAVGMVRAPDQYLYPAPFNLIELVFIAPMEYIVSKDVYNTINGWVMSVLFCVPLSVIALYEAELDPAKNKWMKDWLSHPDEGLVGSAEYQDPEVDGEDAAKGLHISTVPFAELVKVFPDVTHSSEAVIVREVKELKEQIAELKKLITEKASD